MRLFIMLFAVLCIGAYADVAAQCTKNCKGCSKKQTVKNKKMDNNNKALSCKLTSPELRKRKEEAIAKLKLQVIEKRELNDGYSYKFNSSDEMLDMVTAFIKSERLCCDFFNFKLTVTDDAFMWLDIYGQEGAKEFITAELEM
ncbi:MAG TPA: hypothetical protein VGD89_14220 [Flavipsychrobacter sp.]